MNQAKYYEFFLVFYVLTLMITLTVYSKFLIVENLALFGYFAKLFNSLTPFQLALAVPAGTLPFAVTYPLCDVVAEVYGPKPAKRMMLWGVAAELIFAGSILSIISLSGVEKLVPQGSFMLVHGSIMVYAISNITGTLVGKTVNIYVLSKLKVKMLGKAFCWRSLFSTVVGELLLSIVAATISFSHNLPMKDVLLIAFTAFLIKMFVAIVMVKPIQWGAALLKHYEGIDVFDSSVSLNPLQVISMTEKTS